MSPAKLETQDRSRDAAFSKVLHGKSSEEKTAFMAMMKKDKAAQSAAVDEYFKFWDGKGAGQETEKDMKVVFSPEIYISISTQQQLINASGSC
jgi:sterol 24-C-methyltransferase